MKFLIIMCVHFFATTVLAATEDEQLLETVTLGNATDSARELRPAEEACQRYSSMLPDTGSLAHFEEFPWMVALIYFNEFNHTVSFKCAGTIISEWYVLTAANCIKRRQPFAIQIRKISSAENNNELANYHYVNTLTKHPNWSSIRRENDIALIRVSSRIRFNDFIIPACLYTDVADISPDKKLIATGWGSTSAKRGPTSKDIRKAEFISTPLQECNSTFLKYDETAKRIEFEHGIFENQFCAHDPQNKSDSCGGNRGGPLQFFPTNNSLAHVVGIVSFGIDCATELPGIYTRVTSYLDWIEPIVWPNQE